MTSIKFYLVITLSVLSVQSYAIGGSKPLESKPPEVAEIFEQTTKGELEAVQKGLDSGFDINQINKKGETLLMTAAANGHKELTKHLISKKASLNVKDNDLNTALYYAITNEESETAKLLIEAGADLSSLNKLDDTALILATSVNDNNTMKLALEKDVTLINKANKEGKTALLEAARHGSIETVKILLSAGADKQMKNKNGKTPLDIAKKTQNNAVARLLSSKK